MASCTDLDGKQNVHLDTTTLNAPQQFVYKQYDVIWKQTSVDTTHGVLVREFKPANKGTAYKDQVLYEMYVPKTVNNHTLQQQAIDYTLSLKAVCDYVQLSPTQSPPQGMFYMIVSRKCRSEDQFIAMKYMKGRGGTYVLRYQFACCCAFFNTGALRGGVVIVTKMRFISTIKKFYIF